jgi:hypothetical protein
VTAREPASDRQDKDRRHISAIGRFDHVGESAELSALDVARGISESRRSATSHATADVLGASYRTPGGKRRQAF